MPINIGTTDQDVYVGTTVADVYQGTTLLTGGDTPDPLDCSVVQGQSVGDVYCIGTTLVQDRYTGATSADGLSCVLAPVTIATNSTSCGFVPPPDPINTYTAWLDEGDEFDVVTDDSDTVEFPSSYTLIGAPSNQEFQNEQRCRTITTTIETFQPQSRSCTATGGCDGPFFRNDPRGVSRSMSQDCETRVSTTLNPFYTPPLTAESIKRIAGEIVSIDPNNGDITLGTVGQPSEPCSVIEAGPWTATLAPGQTSSFIALNPGDDAEDRNVRVLISGSTPEDFEESCEDFNEVITYTASQRAPSAAAPEITSITVEWTDDNGLSQSDNLLDGGEISISLDTGTEYRVTVNLRVESGVTVTTGRSRFGEGSFGATEAGEDRHHTFVATGVVPPADTASIRVEANEGGIF